VAARAADDKKGVETVVLDVGDLLVITDAFVITSASNTRLVASLAEEVERALKAASGIGPNAIEGLSEGRWVLLDYGSFVVHIFLDETRQLYDLERLWGDAPRVPWQELVASSV
jgi:ribosome-associated protein